MYYVYARTTPVPFIIILASCTIRRGDALGQDIKIKSSPPRPRARARARVCWVVNDVSLTEIFIVSDTFFCIEHFTHTADSMSVCVICIGRRWSYTHKHTHSKREVGFFLCLYCDVVFFFLLYGFALGRILFARDLANDIIWPRSCDSPCARL